MMRREKRVSEEEENLSSSETFIRRSDVNEGKCVACVKPAKDEMRLVLVTREHEKQKQRVMHAIRE